MRHILTGLLILLLPLMTQCRKKSAADEGADLTGVSKIGTVVVAGDQPIVGNPDVDISTNADGKSETANAGNKKKPKAFSIYGQSTWTNPRPKIYWTASENATKYDVSLSSTPNCATPVVSAGNVPGLEWTADEDLADGVYYRCVTARSSAGTGLAANNGLALTVSPSEVAIDLIGAFVNSATQANLAVTGTCNQGSIVVVAEDINAIKVTKEILCVSGAFATTLNVSTLTDGAMNLIATNGSAVAVYAMSKDTIAPTLVAPANDAVATNAKAWSWSCGADVSCTYRFVVDSSALTNPSGAYTSTADTVHTAGNGTVYLHLQAKDAAGNVSAVAHASAVLDTVGPGLTVTAGTNIYGGNQGSYTIGGTCDEGGRSVTWSIDDRGTGSAGTAAITGSTACNGTTWSQASIIVTTMNDGIVDISATLTDVAGNSTNTANTAVKDAAPPTLAVGSAPTANGANQTSYSIAGSCNETGGSVYWQIDDQANAGTPAITGTTTCNGTLWAQASINVSSLDEGTLTLLVDLADAFGNAAPQVSASPSKNTTAPSLNLNAVADVNAANVGSFTITGLCGTNTAPVAWSINDQNGGTPAITGNATCNGTTWSATSINLSSLTDGMLDITADMSDLSNNPAPTESDTATKDVVAPTLGLTAPAAVNAANAGNYSFAGTCNETGGTVNYSVNDQNGGTPAVTGTTSCNGAAWSVTGLNLSSLSDGTQNFAINMNDAVGNGATQATGSATKDVAPPTVTINVPTAVGPSNEAAYAVTGTCSENARNVSITVDDQGNGATAAVTGSSACGANTYSVTLNLSTLDDGTLDITANHTDAVANNATQAIATVNHDTTPPSVPETFVLQTPASNVSNNASPVLRFSSLTGTGTIRVWTDNTCSTQIAAGSIVGANLNVTLTLPSDASYEFWGTAEDALGNRSACSSTSITYTLDRQINAISALALLTPASSPGSNRTPTVTVSGVAADDTAKLYSSSSCFVAQQIGFALATGATVDVTVDSGKFTTDATYPIYARSSDAAGNLSACTTIFVSYVLDTAPPTAPSGITRTDPIPQPGVDTTPTFQVTGLANGNAVRLFSNNTCTAQIGSGVASGTSATFSTNPLSLDGTYNVYATTLDAAGNQSACSTATASYQLDASPPTLTSVRIESGGGKAVAGVGGQAFLTFTSSEPLGSHPVTILGNAATVTNIGGTTYRAVYTFTSGDPSGAVAFLINYSDQVANAGPAISATTDASALTFNAANTAPVFTTTNQTGAEQTLFNLNINDASSGNDTDGDGQAITYSCYYDTSINGVVAMTQTCSTLPGLTVGSGTGVINWTPSYTAAGVYEMRIIGTDGTVDGERTFTLTIANTNRPPVLNAVNDKSLVLADAWTFQMFDANTLSDFDLDGEAITYTCTYDTTIDGSVVSASLCSELDGLNFSGTSGFFTWTVQPTTPGDFEFKIVGSDGSLSDDEIFAATVTIDISRLPQLAMVGSATTSYVASLANDNDVTLNGLPIGGGGSPTIYQVGNNFTITSSAGDLLECSGGCFAITPVDGTAAWSTQTYSGTLLSTYIGRYNKAKIVIAAFDQGANISINQNGVTHATGFVASNSIGEFIINNNIGSLWIQSDAPVSAYVSTNTTYQDDGRVITAPGKEVLAFVSGGGGTPSGVSTTVNNTTINAYRNDGTNFLNQTINISDISIVTSSTSQNPALAAIAVYADKPIVVTQHADGDGTNSTPSLPKSMLSTHFVTPMDGDYVSFASFLQGEVIILDTTGTVVSRNPMTRSGTANAKAPYAFSYNPALVPKGYRFVCSTPCLGIFEPLTNDDETLMTGTLLDPMELTSTSFNSGGIIPASYVGDRASECSGENDFPNLTWASLPWGTKYLAVIVQDTTNSNFVHLNLRDVNPAPGSLGKIEGVAGDVIFPSGIEGTNGYATTGWSGPCDLTTGTHTYRFKVYALSAAIGVAVNNMTQATFEATHAAKILGSASITGTYGP